MRGISVFQHTLSQSRGHPFNVVMVFFCKDGEGLILFENPHLPACSPRPTGACRVLPTPATLLDRAVDTLCPPRIYLYIPVDPLVSVVRSLDVAAAAGRRSNTSNGWGRWVVVGAWSSCCWAVHGLAELGVDVVHWREEGCVTMVLSSCTDVDCDVLGGLYW